MKNMAIEAIEAKGSEMAICDVALNSSEYALYHNFFPPQFYTFSYSNLSV